jgi:flagellar hook-length control protein FliK
LPTPEVTARPGQIGRELGLEIARRSAAGGDELMVRLAPDEMGRIEVRMSFDAGGTLRAVVTAENQAALDMLRRDAGDLGRSLADAGVRADAQSFRFDAKSGDGGTGWQRQGQGRDGGPGDNDAQQRDTFAGEGEDAPYHRLNSTSQIDLMA